MSLARKTRFAPLLLLVLLNAVFVVAADKEEALPKDSAQKSTAEAPEKTETDLTSLVNGAPIAYTVKTGLTPVHNADGDEVAFIFSTAYLAKDNGCERPLLFLYNGGPGVASLYLHMGAFGPKGIPADGDGIRPSRPPFAAVDNPDSLLDVADLVFIDPVGTGYSRLAPDKKEDEKSGGGSKAKTEKKDFWGVEKDIDSIGEFIRVWLTENNRWGSPVLLGGESYGGLRTAGLAGRLEDTGIAPTGVILISPVLSYMDVVELDTRENFGSLVLLFPSLSMTAHYHGRLDADLQALERDELAAKVAEWCESVYLPALRKGNRLSREERKNVAEQAARFSGLPVEVILAENLMVPQHVFCSWLLRDRHLFLGAYDGRLTAYGSSYNYGEDPINSIAGESYKSAFMRFLTETLNLKVGRQYSFASEDAFGAWDFTQGERGLGGFPSTIRYLGSAMRRLPDLKVFAATGRYDLVTSRHSVIHSLSRLDIPPERVGDILLRTYEGGHMMYTNAAAKKQLSDDLRKWIVEAVGKKGAE